MKQKFSMWASVQNLASADLIKIIMKYFTSGWYLVGNFACVLLSMRIFRQGRHTFPRFCRQFRLNCEWLAFSLIQYKILPSIRDTFRWNFSPKPPQIGAKGREVARESPAGLNYNKFKWKSKTFVICYAKSWFIRVLRNFPFMISSRLSLLRGYRDIMRLLHTNYKRQIMPSILYKPAILKQQGFWQIYICSKH